MVQCENRNDTRWVKNLPNRPNCTHWGMCIGTAIDRYYIDRFLERFAERIYGRVLEVKSDGYARSFGKPEVIDRVDVMDILPENQAANVITDLTAADCIPDDEYDCFILTQTLNIIFDYEAALGHATRIVRPGGCVIATVSALNRISAEDGGLEGDYWRFTAGSIRALSRRLPKVQNCEIINFGNVQSCCAFLYGIPAEVLPREQLDKADPYYPLVYGFALTCGTAPA